MALLLVLVLALGLTACALDAPPAAPEANDGAVTDAGATAPGEAFAISDTSAPAAPEANDEAAAEVEAALPEEAEAPAEEEALDPEGWYTAKEDVALYLHLYGKLPGNFITKKEARALGWSGGGLDGYADGKSIGGDVFGNYEGLLPEGSYHECDIGTMHASSRGAERLVYSDDGRVYYTGDHYESFTLLYGEE